MRYYRRRTKTATAETRRAAKRLQRKGWSRVSVATWRACKQAQERAGMARLWEGLVGERSSLSRAAGVPYELVGHWS